MRDVLENRFVLDLEFDVLEMIKQLLVLFYRAAFCLDDDFSIRVYFLPNFGEKVVDLFSVGGVAMDVRGEAEAEALGTPEFVDHADNVDVLVVVQDILPLAHQQAKQSFAFLPFS